MKWFCSKARHWYWSFHDWHFKEYVKVTEPSCGEFDPRTIEDRTKTRIKRVCCRCGMEKISKVSYL